MYFGEKCTDVLESNLLVMSVWSYLQSHQTVCLSGTVVFTSVP